MTKQVEVHTGVKAASCVARELHYSNRRTYALHTCLGPGRSRDRRDYLVSDEPPL